ncbi:hypothetical protein pipiens_007992 [Culex pipiens pipiens]|uniref:PWWP domain-containing protein n=1 Tax=Culex pipiens pipiens TaxID=38569 RepID=A0ABD1DJ04_CULPP
MPLYDVIVWAKYSVFMFWPVIAIPPPAVLDVDEQTDIYLHFIGMHDFGWINWRRIYLYHEGDLDSLAKVTRSSASNESSTRHWRPNGSDRAGGHPPWYVGEVINNEELARRIKQKQDQKVENYYFLTMNTELTTDSGPKGNVARSAEANTWGCLPSRTSRRAFNYNFETFGDQKIC